MQFSIFVNIFPKLPAIITTQSIYFNMLLVIIFSFYELYDLTKHCQCLPYLHCRGFMFFSSLYLHFWWSIDTNTSVLDCHQMWPKLQSLNLQLNTIAHLVHTTSPWCLQLYELRWAVWGHVCSLVHISYRKSYFVICQKLIKLYN